MSDQSAIDLLVEARRADEIKAEAAQILKLFEPGARSAFETLTIDPAISRLDIAIRISIAISLRRLADKLAASRV